MSTPHTPSATGEPPSPYAASRTGRRLVTVDADLLSSSIAETALRLEQAATQAMTTGEGMMALASFCCDVRRASLEVSLQAHDRRFTPERLDELAEVLNQRARDCLATVWRVAERTGLLVECIERGSVSLLECSRQIDPHGRPEPACACNGMPPSGGAGTSRADKARMARGPD